MTDSHMAIDPPFDSVLVLSFGGPEQPEDVLPFLNNVTRGRNVPQERLAEVATQYDLFGGRSPLNDQCRSLVSLLQIELDNHSMGLPVYFGARNWDPYVADTVAEMAANGHRHAAVFVTSAFGSYSGCRQYREDLASAAAQVGQGAPALTKLRLYYNHPGFIDVMGQHLSDGLNKLKGDVASQRVLFSAHSIPVSMAASCSYSDQLNEAARLVVESAQANGALTTPEYELVYQSRSGPPSMPWLDPQIDDRLQELANDGVQEVVVVPIGFTSDHMEVMFDLDTQAKTTAEDLGIGYVRVPTVGTDPTFITMIRQLIEERLAGGTPVALGADGPWPHMCPPDHCKLPERPAATQNSPAK